MLLSRRRQAQALPSTDPTYGLIRGDDESDEIFDWLARTNELPHFSFSLEFLRGCIDLGPVWQEIGAAHGRPDLVAVGKALLAEVPSLRADIEAAMNRSLVDGGGIASDKVINDSSTETSVPVTPSADVCHPYVAGVPSCADMAGKSPASGTQQPYNGRASEPWRSYAGMFYSGQLDEKAVKDIVQYNQRHEKLSHMGVWGGVGGFKNQLMSFTEQGHGYGLLQYDLVDEFLLQLYAEMAHDCTRGSWTCFESRGVPNFTPAGGYTEASQSVVALHLRWAMVWEDPRTHALSLLRAAPRSWLAPGEAMSVSNAPTTHGRVSFNVSSSSAAVVVHAKLVPHAADASKQVVTIKLRRPQGMGKISSVSIAGKQCAACWSDELVTLGALSAAGLTAKIEYSTVQ